MCTVTRGKEGLVGVLQEIKTLQDSLTPDDACLVLPALFSTQLPNNFDLAHRVVLTCNERDVRPYNLLLENCVERGSLAVFDSLIKEMELEQIVYDDETYRLVITVMALRNDVAGLRSFVERMYGFISNAVVGSAERLASMIEFKLSPMSSPPSTPSTTASTDSAPPTLSYPTPSTPPSIPSTPSIPSAPSLSPLANNDFSNIQPPLKTNLPAALESQTSKPAAEFIATLDTVQNPNYEQILKLYNPDDVAQWHTLRDHLKEKAQYVAHVRDYNSYLSSRVRVWDTATVDSFVSEMETHGVNPDIDTYDLRILNLARHNQLEAVYNMVRELAGKGLQTTTNTFVKVLKWSNVTKNYKFARNIWKITKECNLTVSSLGLSELVEAAKHLKDSALKLEVFKLYRARGDPMSTYKYMQLLSDRIEAQDDEGIAEVWGEMKEKGMVDTLAYNTMVSHAGKRGDIALCDELLQEMEASKLDRQVALNSVMLSAAKREVVDWYKRAHAQLKAAGLALTASGYKAALLIAIRDNNGPEIKRIKAEMTKNNINTNTNTPATTKPPHTYGLFYSIFSFLLLIFILQVYT